MTKCQLVAAPFPAIVWTQPSRQLSQPRLPLPKLWVDGFCRTLMWEMESKALLKSRETPSPASHSALTRVTCSSKNIMFHRQDLPFLNSHWLGLIPWLSSLGPVIPLTMICARTMLGPEVRLTDLQFPASSLQSL